jgi:hypothetical protein
MPLCWISNSIKPPPGQPPPGNSFDKALVARVENLAVRPSQLTTFHSVIPPASEYILESRA